MRHRLVTEVSRSFWHVRGTARRARMCLWKLLTSYGTGRRGERGGTAPGVGDRALAEVLAFHSLAMNGGVLDAVERVPAEDLANIGSAFRWFGLESVDTLLVSVRRDIEAGALDELDRAEALEVTADRGYRATLPSDEALLALFRRRPDDDPNAFARS